MPRVHHVKKARKDNPVAKKGESYYWWKFRYGGKRYSLTRPRPSQLTQSPYFGTVRAIIEQIEDTSIADNDDFVSLRDEIVSQIEDLRDETQSSLDNMPDALQYSPTGELLQERVDALENAQSEIESIEEFDEDEPDPSDFDEDTDCDDCDGTGKDEDEDCLNCMGTGTVQDTSEYDDAMATWEAERDDRIGNFKDELIESVSNCEV